ncbi:MAG: hypothetical protein H7249_13880 [Chitinophagaceae bacterium]|nr:hypothetical protein [Oligoflexus sp.]
MKNLLRLGFLFIVAHSSCVAFSHGENRAGPHNGFVRMPGPFHTEVVQDGNNGYKVYLLDLQWKAPTTKDSKVNLAVIMKDNSLINTQCDPKSEVFVCSVSKAELRDAVKLKIEAVREGIKGQVAEYPLPLQLK